MNNLKCPYCGKKISYLSSIKERADGEHYCKRCKRNSTIYFVRNIKIFIIVICLIALAMLSLFVFTPLRGNFLCIFLMFIPFIIFYLCIPLFIRFVPIKHKKKVKKEDDSKLKLETPDSESGTTRIIQPISPTMVADPKGDPEYTRMIPKIRERKKRNVRKDDDVQDISKF